MTDGGFQNHLHMLYGLPNGLISNSISIGEKYYVTSQFDMIVMSEKVIQASIDTPMRSDTIDDMSTNKDSLSVVSKSRFLKASKRKNFKSGPYE